MSTTSPVRRTQEERTALSDGRMFAAAVALLMERGTAGTTLVALGERAGYSRSLVTYRFGTKARLFAHLHDKAVKDWIARVQQAVGDRSGYEALERAIGALYGFIVEEPDEIRAMYLLRYASIDPAADFRANVARAHQAQRRDVQRWIEAGQALGQVAAQVDAKLTAELFCSAVDGLICRWLVNPELPVRELHELLKQEVRRLYEARRPEC